MTSSLSTSAIIVIVVLVSGLLVAILWSFSGHYSQSNTMAEARETVSHEQGAYMREVRRRTHQYAYAESIYGSAGGTTRTSQVWSNTGNGATATTPNTPMAAAAGPSRRDSHGQPLQNFQQDKDGARVNYSTEYDDGADYYEQQSPYGNHDYFEYGYGQQSTLPQQSDEKAEHLPPHQQV